MNRHRDKTAKPFKIGQLVRLGKQPCNDGLFLVVDLAYDYHGKEWDILILSQRTGIKMWRASWTYDPVGKSDE